MHVIALPTLTTALGRPVIALVEPLIPLPSDVPTVPADALVIETIWPSAHVLLTMPATSRRTAADVALDDVDQAQAARAWENWVDRFLAAAIARPRLRASDIPDVIGADREHLATSLLRCWSFLQEVDGSFPRIPAPAVRDLLAFVAARLRRAPSALVREPLPELVFDWRVMLGQSADAQLAEEKLDTDHGR